MVPFAIIAAITTGVRADEKERLRAVPFVFVGSAAECNPAPPGSNIVTSAWLRGMGLPDKGQLNTALAGRDPHFGLLLNKNGLTADCSASGATIRGVKGMKVTATFALGFDYRNGTHCGAGAPRFNVTTSSGSFHFVGGCSNDHEAIPAPQDPLEWTRVRFETINPTESFPPIPPGSVIESISLIFDEGTDTPTVEDPRGVGLSVVDNIYIDGEVISRGQGIAEPHGESDSDD
jgi:hypothetical protein